MKRGLMQIYAAHSDRAVPLYQEAFGGTLISSYPNEDGTFFHAELDVGGVILAVSERRGTYAIEGEAVAGNTMEFGLEFGQGNEAQLRHAYETLKTGAKTIFPLGPCAYSPLMVDFIDQFGVRWSLFI